MKFKKKIHAYGCFHINMQISTLIQVMHLVRRTLQMSVHFHGLGISRLVLPHGVSSDCHAVQE